MRKYKLIPQNFDTPFYIVLWNGMRHIRRLLSTLNFIDGVNANDL